MSINDEAPDLRQPEAQKELESKSSVPQFSTNSEASHTGDDPFSKEVYAPTPANSLISQPWPEIHPDAFYGLAGRIVNSIDPYTEADRKAVLFHILVGFGNVIGDSSHAIVGADRHPARLDAVLVGETSTGRKGTAWGPCREIFQRCDDSWIQNRMRTGGLSTGEGIIYHVRDAVPGDIGIDDKRLLVIEPEFSSMLKIMSREGNSLSGVLRQAWDDGNLSTLTKNSPMRATGAHFALIGHTTREELLRYLDATEKANGFANRILWCLVRRSKLLPDGDPIPTELLTKLAQEMTAVVEWCRADRRIQRDSEAADLWRELYKQLEVDRPGMSGAMLSRAAAQTLRLSLIYALLDRSSVIRVGHLRAAIAVWEVCEASVYHIFGERTGDPTADRIYAELSSKNTLTRDNVINMFQRHKTDEVDRALSMLEGIGRITKESRPTGGRPVTVYQLARKARKA